MENSELDAGLDAGTGDDGGARETPAPAAAPPAAPDPDPTTPPHEKISNGAALVFAIVLVAIAALSLVAAVKVWRSRRGAT